MSERVDFLGLCSLTCKVY